MQKPEGYESTQAFTGDFETLEPGGYVCRIRQATESQTSGGSPLLIVLFDIDEGPHKGYYQRTFDRKKASGQDAKWTGTYRQLTEGKSLPFFKGMIAGIESSNNGYKWDWKEAALKGKVFGGVFGEEEYRKNNGDIGVSVKCTQIRSVEAIRKGIEIPKRRTVKDDGYKPTPAETDSTGTGFYVLNEDDADLPF
jgi:hypothetical protein